MMVKNVILHQQVHVKKYQPSFFQYICVNRGVKVSLKFHTVHELFVRASYLKKNVPLFVYVRKCRMLYISTTRISRMFD